MKIASVRNSVQCWQLFPKGGSTLQLTVYRVLTPCVNPWHGVFAKSLTFMKIMILNFQTPKIAGLPPYNSKSVYVLVWLEKILLNYIEPREKIGGSGISLPMASWNVWEICVRFMIPDDVDCAGWTLLKHDPTWFGRLHRWLKSWTTFVQ